MAFSPDTLRTLERIYWIAMSFSLGICVYIIYKQRKVLEAVLITLIGVTAIFYYWIKWFKVVKPNDLWPPYVSPCPDYLSAVGPAVTGDSRTVCMDFVGVSTKPVIFKKARSDRIPRFNDVDYYSFVYDSSSSQQEGESTDEYRTRKCGQVAALGLSWSGVCE